MIGSAFKPARSRSTLEPATDAVRAGRSMGARVLALAVREVLPLLAVSAVAGWVWYRVLVALWMLRAERLGAAVYLVGPSDQYWVLWAVVLGVGSAVAALRVARRSAVLFAVPALALALLGLNDYARVSEDGIALSRFWSLREERYPFSSVQSIRSAARFRAASGQEVVRPHLVVSFGDGTRWSTLSWVHRPDPDEDRALASFLAARAGKVVEDVTLDE